MKSFYFFLCVFFFIFSAEAQTNFEKGYYISNTGDTINGLIKIRKWKNNPTQFEFKSSQNAASETISTRNAREFGIKGIFNYTGASVEIDRSSNALHNLSQQRSPDFKQEELFLELLVKGNANLYRFEDQNLIRYFYTTSNDSIKQLIYKRYKQNQNIKENLYYKQQLANRLICDAITSRKLEKIKYRESALVAIFKKYNTYTNPNYSNYIPAEEIRSIFNLNAKLGLRDSHLNFQKSTGEPFEYLDFENKSILTAGLEAEFIMPFDHNKWAIFMEPTYQAYSAETFVDNEKSSVDYKSLELPLGIRHYIVLNKQSKFFVNIAILLDFDFNSQIKLKDKEALEIESSSNYAFGFGFNYKKAYSLEVRYLANRNILKNNPDQEPFYSGFSLIFGYTLF